jgi:hypothetical protein
MGWFDDGGRILTRPLRPPCYTGAMIVVSVKGEARVNPAVRQPRVNPWIIALAVVVVPLVVAALTLMAVEPGLLRAIGTALHGSQLLAGYCNGSPVPC